MSGLRMELGSYVSCMLKNTDCLCRMLILAMTLSRGENSGKLNNFVLLARFPGAEGG